MNCVLSSISGYLIHALLLLFRVSYFSFFTFFYTSDKKYWIGTKFSSVLSIDDIWTRDFILQVAKMYRTYRYSERWHFNASFDTFRAWMLKFKRFVLYKFKWKQMRCILVSFLLISGKEKNICTNIKNYALIMETVAYKKILFASGSLCSKEEILIWKLKNVPVSLQSLVITRLKNWLKIIRVTWRRNTPICHMRIGKHLKKLWYVNCYDVWLLHDFFFISPQDQKAINTKGIIICNLSKNLYTYQ